MRATEREIGRLFACLGEDESTSKIQNNPHRAGGYRKGEVVRKLIAYG